MKKTTIALLCGIVGVAGCASMMATPDYDKTAMALMQRDFKNRGQATVDRLVQDEVQATCSKYTGQPLPKEVAKQIEESQIKLVKFPADGKLMGDWTKAERVAQNGQGGQWSDDPSKPAGGNCYACHQMAKAEISYGNIGPSLYHFGKLRGTSESIQKYTYGKIYNPHAYSACSNMPRFGHKNILTEAQIKDMVAYLLDPNSPVNK